MNTTSISWTEKTWNPVSGCSPISEGCANCYAKRMAQRLRGRCGYPEDEPFRVTLHPNKLDEPLRMRKPSRIFVCSMAVLLGDRDYIGARPDIDNYCKAVMDALNGMIWQDDGQIVQLEASKRYGEPRAEIEIREAEQ